MTELSNETLREAVELLVRIFFNVG